MKNAMRIDEIEGYLRDGGSLENVLIEPDPSSFRRIWSKAGMEIDLQKEESHNWDYHNFERRYGSNYEDAR